ncbi:MAG: BlaI/MecI/CopY family transcriptional regulator [Patescibacteria group bacterium]|nr:BlaI/MecI/CopY family transcriptional regulator [Patescibacteria group bacterium]
MTIIDELLIVLENGQIFSLEQIKKLLPDRTLQTVSSTLGRLVAKKYVDTIKTGKNIQYKINERGLNLVNGELSNIKFIRQNKWNGSWQIAVFNIPEKIRYARDIFRIKLTNLGFGRVLNSLWISCWNRSNEIMDIAKELKIEKYINLINTGKTKEADNKNIIENFEWDWNNLNKEYKKFINQSRLFFLSRKNSLEAKKLVYQYAKILDLDPRFPEELQPKKYLGKKAFEIYLKIRPYCYSKK